MDEAARAGRGRVRARRHRAPAVAGHRRAHGPARARTGAASTRWPSATPAARTPTSSATPTPTTTPRRSRWRCTPSSSPRSRRAEAPARRPHVADPRRRLRRRADDRRRLRQLLRAARHRRQRHDQDDAVVGPARAARSTPTSWPSAARRPVADRRARSRRSCGGPTRCTTSGAPPPPTPSCSGVDDHGRRQGGDDTTRRPTATRTCSPTRTASTSAATRTRTCRSASPSTSASACTSPGSRAGCSSRSCSAAFADDRAHRRAGARRARTSTTRSSGCRSASAAFAHDPPAERPLPAELAVLVREYLMAGHMIDRAGMPHVMALLGPDAFAPRRDRGVDGRQPGLHQADAAGAGIRGRHRRDHLQGHPARHRRTATVPRLPIRSGRPRSRRVLARPLRRAGRRRAHGRGTRAHDVPRHRGPHLRRHRRRHQPARAGSAAPSTAPGAGRPHTGVPLDSGDRRRARGAAHARGGIGDGGTRAPRTSSSTRSTRATRARATTPDPSCPTCSSPTGRGRLWCASPRRSVCKGTCSRSPFKRRCAGE